MLVTIVVLDSVGVGELADAANFGDAGAHTINNIMAKAPTPLPNLSGLGLGRPPDVRRDDDPDHGVAAGDGVVGEEDYGQAGWWNLDTTGDHPFGGQLAFVAAFQWGVFIVDARLVLIW